MLGDIFGGIARIAGGFIDRESARDTNNMTKDMAQQNIALQREFAQHGIQWKVEDAKRAGIHPIYALGSAGASFSPVSANFTSPPSVAADMAAVGQDVGRAVNATRTKEQRVDVSRPLLKSSPSSAPLSRTKTFALISRQKLVACVRRRTHRSRLLAILTLYRVKLNLGW